ncbi:NAD(P)-dependent oxidoreductase [Acerihabitans sp.]|uniref:NAD(P)-dependent oxidoreductase n=1 Tax=Acerihabitans sp. TaxID=2811394 RepID=UPI002ED7F278
MKKILLTRNIPHEAIADVEKNYLITMPDSQKDIYTKDELIALLPEHDALLSINEYPIPEDMIAASSRLKAIGNGGAGYNHIDINAATERGIAVINTPFSVVDPTAEFTIGLMLSITRGIVMYNNELKATRQCRKDMFFERDMVLEGKTLGIIGMGNIGKKLSEKARVFGMKIRYFDMFRLSPELEAAYHAEYIPLEDLLRHSDVVAIHAPYLKETHHLINDENIKLMKPTAYLINAARGPIVEERALLDALKNKTIRGAALDVFEFEPAISEEMAAIDNIVITPHAGTNLKEVRVTMLKEALTGMTAVLEGKRPTNLVNRSVFEN